MSLHDTKFEVTKTKVVFITDYNTVHLTFSTSFILTKSRTVLNRVLNLYSSKKQKMYRFPEKYCQHSAKDRYTTNIFENPLCIDC